MPQSAGRALRVELYGIAVAVVVVAVRLDERIRFQSEIQEGILQRMQRPQIVQNNLNHQSVVVESEQTRLVREVAKKNGWIDGNVSGTESATSNKAK